MIMTNMSQKLLKELIIKNETEFSFIGLIKQFNTAYIENDVYLSGMKVPITTRRS